MPPQITVLMPTYKGAKYLRETIDSVLDQTFKDFEFLIINDCSPDDSEDIIKSYKDSRIRYIKNPHNLGISGSSNYGISIAQGSYIARQDHDDISHPDRLEKQFNYLETHPEIGICGTGYHVFGRKNKKVFHPKQDELIKTYLLFKCSVAHQTTMMRRDLFQNNGLTYDASFVSSNDRKLWIDACSLTKFHNIPEILLEYRMYKGMTSKTKRNIVLEEGRRLRDIFYQKLDLQLSTDDKSIIDTYLMQGRAHITDKNCLIKIEHLLQSFINANQKTHIFDEECFKQVCGMYFQKKCTNYSFFSSQSSAPIFYNSSLCQYNQLVPRKYKFLFKLLNILFFWKK